MSTVLVTYTEPDPPGLLLTYVESGSAGTVTAEADPRVVVVSAGGMPGPAGPQGPMGPQGEWDAMTQAEYDVLTPKDPSTLYVILPT